MGRSFLLRVTAARPDAHGPPPGVYPCTRLLPVSGTRPVSRGRRCRGACAPAPRRMPLPAPTREVARGAMAGEMEIARSVHGEAGGGGELAEGCARGGQLRAVPLGVLLLVLSGA